MEKHTIITNAFIYLIMLSAYICNIKWQNDCDTFGRLWMEVILVLFKVVPQDLSWRNKKNCKIFSKQSAPGPKKIPESSDYKAEAMTTHWSGRLWKLSVKISQM
jgi:hypothetical protein